MTASLERFRVECARFFKGIYVGEDRVIVFGEGGEDSRIMLIGEAPGENEALQGRPFVGKAGEQLNVFLKAVGIDRSSLYITNAVKFRPTRVSAARNVVNRAPTREEIALFRPWLMREIDIVNPRLIVTFGNTALHAVLNKPLAIGECHGVLIEPTSESKPNIPIFPLYHPASVIYKRTLSDAYVKDLHELAKLARDL